MFGTKWRRTDIVESRISKLVDVLDRRKPIESLDALASSMSHKPIPRSEIAKIAIGLDSSAFLRIAQHTKSADIVDYFGVKHTAPLILPGQAVQEFWNNITVVDTVAIKLKKKFGEFKAELAKVDHNFGEFGSKMSELLDRFSEEHGYVYDEAVLRKTIGILGALKDRAFLAHVPRSRLSEIALSRKRTKTPPGFKDDGDGDFFIWAEFLYGLLHAQDTGKPFSHAVVVTLDQKPDWSRAGVAHPVLTAEMRQLLGVNFEVWTIDQLVDAIGQ